MNDIYAYFDYHGTLKERVSAPVRANSTQVNSIYAYWDNQSVEPVTYSVTWRLVGSDSLETTSEHYAETLAIPANYLGRRDLVFFKEARLYNFIRFPVPSAVTAVAGTYVATIRYALSTQATFVLGSLTFEVEGDQGIVLGESLTLDQYNYLLEQYSEVYDWATLRFLPLTGGTLTGDLEVTGTTTLDYLNVSEIGAGSISSSGTIRTSDKAAAKEYWLSIPDKTIIKLDNSIDGPGYSGELQFGIPSGDYSPAFYGSLGVKMLSGREKVYPAVRFNYYDDNDSYESTTEEQIATQQWSDARYLKLAGGSVTGPVTFNSSATFNSPLTSYGYFTLQSGMTISGLEIHGGNEDHAGNATFTKNITISAAVPTQASHATRKDYVDNLIASVKANAFQVVQALPQSGEEGIIYLVPVQGEDYYTQYIWEGNSWLNIGDTDIDLSGYLPLTGGTITGDLAINGSVTIDGKDLETELDSKLTRGDFDSSTGVGYANFANNLLSTEGLSVSSAFETEVVGGASASSVEGGAAKVEKVAGKTVAFNQLVVNGNFESTSNWTIEGATMTVSNNKAIITAGTGTLALYQSIAKTANHKYFLRLRIKSSASQSININCGSTLTTVNIGTTEQVVAISFNTPSGNNNLNITGSGLSAGSTIEISEVIVIDLTLTGEESLTLDQLKAKYNKYYPYNAGTLYPSVISTLDSFGANLFDGEWESGTIIPTNGEDYPSNMAKRTPDYIAVSGGQTYTFENDNNGNHYLCEYDANHAFIKSTKYESSTYVNSIQLDYSTAYVRLVVQNATTETNFHLGSATIGFTPYVGQLGTINLPSAPITLRGVNSAKDELSFVEDGAGTYTAKLIRRVGHVDLGTLTYTKESNGRMTTNGLSSLIERQTEYYGKSSLACGIYGATSPAKIEGANPPDKSISIGGNTYAVCIYDSAYADVASFKTAMSGVYMDYPLATPTEETLATGLTENQVSFLVQKYGILNLPNENAQYGALPTLTMFYEKSLKSFVEAVGDEISYAPSNIITPTKLADALESKADKVGVAPSLVAGKAYVADALETSIGTEQETPISFNTVGGDSDVSSGEHRLDALTGVSVVDNQLVPPMTTYSINGITLTPVGDGSYTLSGTATADVYILFGTAGNRNGHKIFVNLANQQTTGVRLQDASKGFIFTYSQSVIDINYTNNVAIHIYVANGTDLTTPIKVKPLFIDLTQRYGNNTVVNAIIGDSNQVANLLRFDPNILKLTSYEPGALTSSKTKELLSVGYNQWDEQWELGSLYNGEKVSSTTEIRSKNYIPVIGGKEYRFIIPSGTAIYVDSYDINKNYIGINSISGSGNRTLSTNTAFIRFRMNSAYGTTYNHDICVFIYHDGSRIGYEPYETHSYQLPNIVQRGILKVDASGNIYADGDVAYPDGTGETRMKEQALKDLNFTYNSNNFFEVVLSDAEAISSGTPTAISNLYTRVATNELSSASDKSFTIWNGRLYIKDSAYTDATSFKNHFGDNDFIYYKLATPTPITFDPFTPNIFGDDFGTFQALDEDGNEASLQGFNIFYRANIAGYAESLYANTNGDPEKIVYDDEVYAKAQADARFALKEALGGTLRQVLAVKASIDFENTAYVDLGNQTYTAQSTYSDHCFAFTITGVKSFDNNDGVGNILCSKYKSIPNGSQPTASYGVSIYKTTLRISDPSFAGKTATEVAELLKGVLLAYEKAS